LLPSIGEEDRLKSRTTSIQEREDDEDITPPRTRQAKEEVQHGCSTRLPHGGGPVHLKLESISDLGAVPGKINAKDTYRLRFQ